MSDDQYIKDSSHPEDGWEKWAYHVLAELKRLNQNIDEIRRDMIKITIEVAQLKIKSGMWGAVAGAVTVIIMIGLMFLKNTIENKKVIYAPYPTQNMQLQQGRRPVVTQPMTTPEKTKGTP